MSQGVAFVLADLVGPEVDAAGYFERVRLLGAQLRAWKVPSPRPSFRELVDSGAFVPLCDVLKATLPFIKAAVEALDASDISTATAVRDAVVLSAVAGDGGPNERPSELAYATDGRSGGACQDRRSARAGPAAATTPPR